MNLEDQKEICTARGFFVVTNQKGLHTRPSTELVKCACSFSSHINLTFHDLVVNAKSLLGIMTLGAALGARIEVEAEGTDAQEAIDSILELARNNFTSPY